MDKIESFKETTGLLKTLVFTLLAIVVVVILLVWVFGLYSNPQLEAWLNSPISELKIWHLLLILFFTANIARD